MGRLAGGIAHDFNNLLVVILSHARLLQRDLRTVGMPELARSYDSTIDLVITDIVMPRLSGPDFVKQLQELRPGTKVIFISGDAQDWSVTEAGVNDDAEILDKPFDPDDLLAVARKLLDHA